MRSASAVARKAEADRERVAARVVGSTGIRFMGRNYPTLVEFQRAFPAFGGDDALRAIRAGCETVTEVETYCWHRKNKGRLASIAAARNSQFAAKYGRA